MSEIRVYAYCTDVRTWCLNRLVCMLVNLGRRAANFAYHDQIDASPPQPGPDSKSFEALFTSTR